ncbi:MAG TPA: nucleotidyltransferase family protein [Verrucomicrobiae bacterium]|nr:nucleotidyltransferase family protein [Verrucomicrobiae bacterium]
MKAFILAAGLGTRLRSLGLDIPKVMVPVGGKPLLEHHLELFKRQGIREFIVNLHYLPEKITSYFGDGKKFGVTIEYSHEPEILGTAGAVKKMEHKLHDGTFLVFYGDNLVRVEFAPLVEFHRSRKALATVALFESPEPWTGGVVETEPSGRVRRFVEKPDPKQVSTNLISAGIFVLEPAILEEIPAGQFCDFGKEAFPKLLKKGLPVYAMKPEAYVQDVGTPERLAKAQRDFEKGLLN